MFGVEAVEHESGGLQAAVVTGDAVALHGRLMRRARAGGGCEAARLRRPAPGGADDAAGVGCAATVRAAHAAPGATERGECRHPSGGESHDHNRRGPSRHITTSSPVRVTHAIPRVAKRRHRWLKRTSFASYGTDALRCHHWFKGGLRRPRRCVEPRRPVSRRRPPQCLIALLSRVRYCAAITSVPMRFGTEPTVHPGDRPAWSSGRRPTVWSSPATPR